VILFLSIILYFLLLTCGQGIIVFIVSFIAEALGDDECEDIEDDAWYW